MMGPLERALRDNPKPIVAATPNPPKREFVILFVARTGSSHLTELLRSSEVGAPLEWLNPDFIAGQAEGFGATDFEQYFTRMRSWWQRHDVFGHEMTIYFYEAYSKEVRLEDWFDFACPSILLFREDLIAQAVSLFLAIRRSLYHKTDELGAPLAEVAYDGPGLVGCVETLADEERRLRAFVETRSLTPRFLSYEGHTAAAPQAVVSAIAAHVGMTPRLDLMTSPHRKLGDGRNRAYADRFRAENADLCAQLDTGRQWLLEGLRTNPLL